MRNKIIDLQERQKLLRAGMTLSDTNVKTGTAPIKWEVLRYEIFEKGELLYER